MQSSPSRTALGTSPGDLYNANLALCLRVNELLQISGRQWFESGTSLIENAVNESKADLARLAKPEAGSPTPPATGDVFRGGFKRWSVHMQAARSLALEQQRSFSTNLREAMSTWKNAVNGTFTRDGGNAPLANPWLAEMTKWTQAWPVAVAAK